MSAPPALHPLGVGELLDSAIYVYRKSLATLIGIGAVVAVPFFLLQSVAAFFNAPLGPFFGGPFSPLGPGLSADAFSFVYLPLVYLATTAMSAQLGPIAIVIEVGALAFAVSEQRMGRRATIGRAYRQALRRWTALLGSAILVQLSIVFASGLFVVPLAVILIAPLREGTPLFYAALAGFIPASVPLVFFAVRWSLATQAIVLENLDALRGMRRSWSLVKRSFWRAWAFLLVAGGLVNLLMYAVFMGVQSAASLLPNSLLLHTVVTSAGGLVAATAIQPLAHVAVTLLYYDLRIRHEGYDLQIAIDQLKQSARAVTEGPA